MDKKIKIWKIFNYSKCCYETWYSEELIKEENEQYKKSKQASYEMLQDRCNKLEWENRELKETLKTSCKYYAPCGECALTAKNCYGTSKCIETLQQKLERIKELCNRIFEDETSTVSQCMVVNKILPIIEESQNEK